MRRRPLGRGAQAGAKNSCFAREAPKRRTQSNEARSRRAQASNGSRRQQLEHTPRTPNSNPNLPNTSPNPTTNVTSGARAGFESTSPSAARTSPRTHPFNSNLQQQQKFVARAGRGLQSFGHFSTRKKNRTPPDNRSGARAGRGPSGLGQFLPQARRRRASRVHFGAKLSPSWFFFARKPQLVLFRRQTQPQLVFFARNSASAGFVFAPN